MPMVDSIKFAYKNCYFVSAFLLWNDQQLKSVSGDDGDGPSAARCTLESDQLCI